MSIDVRWFLIRRRNPGRAQNILDNKLFLLWLFEFRGPVPLTRIAKRLAVQLPLPVFTTYVCRGWYSNNKPSACKANALTHCATAAVK